MASCRAPYAGVSRVRFQGTLSTPFLGYPWRFTRKIRGPGSAANPDAVAGGLPYGNSPATARQQPSKRAYCVAKMNV